MHITHHREHITQAIKAEQWPWVLQALQQDNWGMDHDTALLILQSLHVQCNLLLAQRMDWTPLHEHVWRGLSFPHDSVRYWWAKRSDYVPTDAMSWAAISDGYSKVRTAWSERQDTRISREMQDMALRSGGQLLLNWLRREDLTWTHSDYAYIWKHHRDQLTRISVLMQDDFVPRWHHWVSFVYASAELRSAWWSNHNWKTPPWFLMLRLFTSQSALEVVNILKRWDWDLKELHILCIWHRFHNYPEVLSGLAARPDFFITNRIESAIGRRLCQQKELSDGVLSFLDDICMRIHEKTLQRWADIHPCIMTILEKKTRRACYEASDSMEFYEDGIL